MNDSFTQPGADATVDRINKLTPTTQPGWGKMNVSQMLAHCNVTYEMAYENKHRKPNPIMGLFLKLFVKQFVVGPAPYKKNLRTAPAFIITDSRNFDVEKKRLVDFVRKTQGLGRAHFEGRNSLSFGPLTSDEWNTLFAKHLDHHLTQFGV